MDSFRHIPIYSQPPLYGRSIWAPSANPLAEPATPWNRRGPGPIRQPPRDTMVTSASAPALSRSSPSDKTTDSERTAVEMEQTERILRNLNMTPDLDHHYASLQEDVSHDRNDSPISASPHIPRTSSGPLDRLRMLSDPASVMGSPQSSVFNAHALNTPASELSTYSSHPSLMTSADSFNSLSGYLEPVTPREDLESRPFFDERLAQEPSIANQSLITNGLGLHFGQENSFDPKEIDHARLQARIEELRLEQRRLEHLQALYLQSTPLPSRGTQLYPQAPSKGFSVSSTSFGATRDGHAENREPVYSASATLVPTITTISEMQDSNSPYPPSLASSTSSYYQPSSSAFLSAFKTSPADVFPSAAQSDRGPDGLTKEPLNFLTMLQPSSHPPYSLLVTRIVRHSDQQASIFLQQKIKACGANSQTDLEEKSKIISAILEKPFEMMTNRFGNWAYQRCLEEPCTPEETRRVASSMRGHVVDLATNCYGTHCVQKALDCDEDIRLMVVSELLLADPSSTLTNKHASHVWSKIMELSWSPPAPPIFEYVNNALRGRWVELATHETGSLVIQHLFENCGQEDTKDCLQEILDGFERVVRDQWGSFVIQHMLEHGLPSHRDRAVSLLCEKLQQYSMDNQAMKSIEKALKVCPDDALERIVQKLTDSGTTGRRALLVDIALNANGSQLIIQVLQAANPVQRRVLYNAIKKHIVTLKGNKAGSKIVWHFERVRANES